MEEGKKRSQIKDSETFAFIATVGIIILFLMLILTSCNTSKAQDDVGKVYINIDGKQIELVSDEYGVQYLKQYTAHEYYIYIPYPGETEQTDSLQFYNTKR
jgi:hypothetical protein